MDKVKGEMDVNGQMARKNLVKPGVSVFLALLFLRCWEFCRIEDEGVALPRPSDFGCHGGSGWPDVHQHLDPFRHNTCLGV